MSDFLLLLIKMNLAMGAAIVLVSLMRRPLRAQFGAPIAYAIWLLVPIVVVASLLPPREVPAPAQVATVPAPPAPMPIMGDATHSALRAVEQLAGESALVFPASTPSLPSTHGIFDATLLLFTAWVLGTVLMAIYLGRVQIRFSAAMRRGQAGPAVLGFFFPRIVTPDGFQEKFTPQEQAAILAHEHAHLVRQDARINALAAVVQCLCWFNPLVHLGARWLRIDQELACDAAVTRSISRLDYARTLLKSQALAGIVPFGSNWPGPQHPLVERIALLQRKRPGTARRLAGAGFVLLAAASAGLSAWAAQPPVTAKSMAVSANSTGSGNHADASKFVQAAEGASAAPVAPMQAQATPNPVMTANAQSTAQKLQSPNAALPTNQVAANQAAQLQTNEAATTSASPAAGLTAAPPLPKEVAVPEALLASNDPPATPVQPPAVALNDQPVGQIQHAARNAPAGSAQAALNTPPDISSYDRTAVPDARRVTRHAMDGCNARLKARDIKSNSGWASCSMAAERGYFTAIKLKNMGSFDAYAASYLALAADLDANRISKIQARRRADEILKQFFVACDCEVKRGPGFGPISPPGGIFGGGGYGGNSGNSLSGTIPSN